jgi:hypothetical protein
LSASGLTIVRGLGFGVVIDPVMIVDVTQNIAVLGRLGAGVAVDLVATEQYPLAFEFFLCGNGLRNVAERFVGEWAEGFIACKQGGGEQSFQIHIDGLGDDFAVGAHDDHLSCRDFNAFRAAKDTAFSTFVAEFEGDGAFEGDEFDPFSDVILHQQRGAGDGGGDGGGADGGSSGTFGDLEQDGSLIQVDIATAPPKTECGIGSEAGDGFILECQLGAGAATGLDGGVTADAIAHLGLSSGFLRLVESDVIDAGGDLGGLEGSGMGARQGDKAGGGDEKGGFHGVVGGLFDGWMAVVCGF